VLVGESYGTWRVGGTADLLTSRGIPVQGAVLISGGIPGAMMPNDFSDAMTIPGRTAAAIYHRRLSADLLGDPAATRRVAAEWAANVYRPALARIAALSPVEREEIAHTLARYIGIDAARIDRQTLIVSNRDYLAALSGNSKAALDVYDMRRSGPQPDPVGDGEAILAYLRGELGYATDLAYTGLEDGYMPMPGAPRRSTGSRWTYNHVVLTQQMRARTAGGGGPPASQPWLQRAMARYPGLHVLVAAGRYDSYNSCEGNTAVVTRLAPPLAGRMTALCYEGGHMMYLHDATNRRRLAKDVATFVAVRNRLGPP
jgi:carboxypeptidase C (cathepsin A)